MSKNKINLNFINHRLNKNCSQHNFLCVHCETPGIMKVKESNVT